MGYQPNYTIMLKQILIQNYISPVEFSSPACMIKVIHYFFKVKMIGQGQLWQLHLVVDILRQYKYTLLQVLQQPAAEPVFVLLLSPTSSSSCISLTSPSYIFSCSHPWCCNCTSSSQCRPSSSCAWCSSTSCMALFLFWKSRVPQPEELLISGSPPHLHIPRNLLIPSRHRSLNRTLKFTVNGEAIPRMSH